MRQLIGAAIGIAILQAVLAAVYFQPQSGLYLLWLGICVVVGLFGYMAAGD